MLKRAFLALPLIAIGSPCLAQISIGGEYGAGKCIQQGSYSFEDQVTFVSGSDVGQSGGVFFEYALNRRYAIGFSAISGSKRVTSHAHGYTTLYESSRTTPDTLVAEPLGSASFSAGEFGLYIQYHLLDSSLFVQFGPALALNQNLNPTERVDMATHNPENPVATTSRIGYIQSQTQFLLLASFGFDLPLSKSITFAPKLEVEYPLTALVANSDLNVWMISCRGSLKFAL